MSYPWIWSLAALALTGCQDPLCADYAATYADVAAKSQPCLEQVPLPPFDAGTCEHHLGACDDRDRAQLEAQRACYAQLGTCQPDQQDAFLQALTDCDDHAVSNTCEAAIF